jgi:hypothetical protein
MKSLKLCQLKLFLWLHPSTPLEKDFGAFIDKSVYSSQVKRDSIARYVPLKLSTKTYPQLSPNHALFFLKKTNFVFSLFKMSCAYKSLQLLSKKLKKFLSTF